MPQLICTFVENFFGMITENDFIFIKTNHQIQTGKFCWSAPSNIALVKYWGKKNQQIPANSSLSFTLKNCKTITSLFFSKNENQNKLSFELCFEGLPKPEFDYKIQQFFEKIEPFCSFLKDFHFKIDTQNTFPHSSGIASSASAMAALSMTIMSLENAINPTMSESYFYQKASFLARLGSGSACRSIQNSVIVWGDHPEVEGSSNLIGISIDNQIDPVFKDFQDCILLVDKGEKQVSSSVGHGLMVGHPFAERRFVQANEQILNLKKALKSGDLEAFIAIVEREALTLHAMMMTSMPYFILMKPNTLSIINAVWQFRNETKIPLCFTLDAGANVHLLFPKSENQKVLEFIQDKLVDFCQNGSYICDEIGIGSENIF